MVEQAIYTWSKVTLSGRKGQGFGAVSPGLMDSVTWLESQDLHRFQPLDRFLTSESAAYPGWREQVTLGCFAVGDLSFLYRKIPHAGRDGARRNRFVVHLLIGRREDLNLSTVAHDDPHWLTADQCPLNMLPGLSALALDEFRPVGPHDCSTDDDPARALLRELVDGGGTMRREFAPPAPSQRLVSRVLTAVPAALWPSVELDWAVGAKGPVVSMRVIDGAVAMGVASDPRTLACPLHAEVEEIWQRVGSGRRSWGGFADAVRASQAPQRAEEKRPSTDAQPTNPRAQVAASIAKTLVASTWDSHRRLDDREAMLALRAMERLPVPPDGWLAVLSGAELRAIFGGIESSAAFARATRFFEAAETPVSDLAAAWHNTGIAAVGAALLSRDTRTLGPRWAVPRQLNQREIEKLVRHLRTSHHGLAKISLLIRGGFADDQGGRHAIVRAMRAAGATPREIYGRVLVDAQLASPQLLSFVREDINGVSEWLGLPEPYQRALRDGLELGLKALVRDVDWWLRG